MTRWGSFDPSGPEADAYEAEAEEEWRVVFRPPEWLPLWVFCFVPVLGLMVMVDELGWPKWLVVAVFVVWAVFGICAIAAQPWGSGDD